MLRHLLLFWVFVGLNFTGFAQTCNIVSADVVCQEELISFDVTASAGIISTDWDMGDGTTTTQKSFSHKYATSGEKTIIVILKLSGGASCTATKKVTVYSSPKFKVKTKADNIYCLYNNRVCLIDSSNGGDGGLKIKKRIILWDDGDQSSVDWPGVGQVICHKYSAAGTYKITIELTNEKDCKIKQEINIKILQDMPPVFNITPGSGCDSAEVTFQDLTVKDSNEIVKRTYTWGDGKSTTTTSRKVSHYYKAGGTYKVSLTLSLKNGCQTTKDSTVDVFIPEIKFDTKISAYRRCLGLPYRFEQNDELLGAYYQWTIAGDRYEGKLVDVSPPLGKHRVYLSITYAGCTKIYDKDSIEVVGIMPEVKVLNSNQCSNKDTVFFCEKDLRYGTKNVSFLWNFGDYQSPQCTTSIKNGKNLKSNCNYTTDSVGKHFYVNGQCRRWGLTIIDHDYGCNLVDSGIINTVRPPKPQFTYKTDRKCLGLKPEYKMFFEHDLCPIIDIKINLDSACDKTKFLPLSSYYYYQSTCNKDGWVTVGFAVKYGDRKVYRRWCDTSDYYIDPSRECYDTIWFHHWFQMLPEPFPPFEVSGKCVPSTVKPLWIDSLQKNISLVRWTWGDNSKIDSLFPGKNDSILPHTTHTFNKAGAYNIKLYIENINRCYGLYAQTLNLGFEMAMDFDTVICPGLSIKFNEKINYLFSGTDYWHFKYRKNAGKELFAWDFDDGRGFVTDTSKALVKFPKNGWYKIRLMAKDSAGCRDTLERMVNVGGVHAGIKAINKKIICDDIIQFFDSSYSDFLPPTDSIIKHYWEFGDYRNPSTLKDPYHYYKYFGDYTIKHVVENTRGCTDSAYVKIKIEGPVPSFDIISDTVACMPFTARFKNTSQKTKDFIWFFGDPTGNKLSTKKDTNVSFTYTKPGIYNIYLFGNDSVVNPNAGGAIYYCKATFPDTSQAIHPIRRIIILPIPKVDFGTDSVQCLEKPIQVRDRSDSIYKRYKWVLKGIDSTETANKVSYLNTGKDTGMFTIKYTPWYTPKGPYQRQCYDTITKTIRITDIKAEFDFVKDPLCPIYTFTNTSRSSTSIKWDFNHGASGDNNTSTANVVTHNYVPDKGKFYPSLAVENRYGCKDTIFTELDVDFNIKAILPNVFTPGDLDGLNDAYDIVMENVETYDLKIYNRWGLLVYSSKIDGVGNDGINWNGKAKGNGQDCPEGTYFYIFNYKHKCEDKKREGHGAITLIR